MAESSVHDGGQRKRRRVETESPSAMSSLFLEGVTIVPNAQTGLIDEESFFEIFDKYQLVYIPKVDERAISLMRETKSPSSSSSSPPIGWKDLHSLFTTLEKDKKTWTIETHEANGNGDRNDSENRNDNDEIYQNGIDAGEGDANNSNMKMNMKVASIKPGDFLDGGSKAMALQRGYCSFIVQHDKGQMEQLLQKLPLTDLPIHHAISHGHNNGNGCENEFHAEVEDKGGEDNCNGQALLPPSSPRILKYGPSVWIFFGRNPIHDAEGKRMYPGPNPLDGRGEHTDSVSHDATWHYQLSGVKLWHLRPTEELLCSFLDISPSDSTKDEENSSYENNKGDLDTMVELWKKEQNGGDDNGITKLDIQCEKGDVLILNTRLWWHSTTLPGQPTASADSDWSVPSVSYARDMYYRDVNVNEDENDNQTENMTNLDGLYAANAIEAGTIVFRESSMPDCELHRTKEDPNCEIIELDDGEGAIVSCRDIKAGEFFCILESDSEEEGDEVDYGDGEDN